ncbi:MAG: ABC transporter ATP-binding protein [Myxococcales bacterium]|nr:ABC transporter ATP-binding protein [Myxococcales bacterium]
MAALGAPLLAVGGLSKRFGRGAHAREAVRDVAFTVRRGDVYGLIGPNGAGKSTLLRMIMGLIRPSAGEVTLHGEPMTAASRQRIGAAIEYPSFYGYLSARENISMLGAVSDTSITDADIARALARVGLSARADEPTRHFSQGMKQRLAIALALVASPDLIILDEPTNGLDPHGIRDLRRLIRSLAHDDGLTILLSSHLLVEVEQLCNRALVMHGGKTVWEGEVAGLVAAEATLVLHSASPDAGAALSELGVAFDAEGGSYTMRGVHDPSRLVAALVARGILIEALVPQAPTLESLFFSLLGAEATPT